MKDFLFGFAVILIVLIILDDNDNEVKSSSVLT